MDRWDVLSPNRGHFGQRPLSLGVRLQIRLMARSFSDSATRFHDALARALAGLQGQEIDRKLALTALLRKSPDLLPQIDWILLSDHCSNHTNKGACECALTKGALLERISHGRYRVL